LWTSHPVALEYLYPHVEYRYSTFPLPARAECPEPAAIPAFCSLARVVLMVTQCVVMR